MQIDIPIIPRMKPIWTDHATWYSISGGRGSGKSIGTADVMLTDALRAPRDAILLSCREIQASIEDSNHRTLQNRIYELGMDDLFDVQARRIICKRNRAQISFEGLRQNASKILSKFNLKRIHVDEASYISKESIRLLTPTITRNTGIKLYFTYNPRKIDDPVYQMFLASEAEKLEGFGYDRRDKAIIVKDFNWDENPYLTKETHPEWWDEMIALKASDWDEFNHVYNGKLWQRNDALVFKKSNWSITDDLHIPEHAQTFGGMDIGDTSPTCFLKFHVWDRIIHITHEMYETRTNPFELADMMANVPGASNGEFQITADSNAPRVIREIQTDPRYNFKIQGAKKSPLRRADLPYLNSYVRQGLFFLKGYHIHIHPRCKNTIREFGLYSYAIDEQTEQVLDTIMKKDDHSPDALRYGIEPLLRQTWEGSEIVSGVG